MAVPSIKRLIEFRRCQKCGQIEKASTGEAVVKGEHSDKCDNEQEKWTVFTAADDWKPKVDQAPPSEIIIPTSSLGDDIANYSIGFVKFLHHNGSEDAVCAGSGTLVRVGKVHGILTATHVLENLPSSGQVGLAQFFGRTVHFRKQTFNMDHAETIMVGGKGNAPSGPDLGFLRLATKDAAWLAAIQSFYNMQLHSSDHTKEPPAPNSVYVIVGAIDERTKNLPAERPGEYRKGFEAIITDSNMMWFGKNGGFTLVGMKPKSYPDFSLPGDFGGTSGGGLWQIYFNAKDGKVVVVAKHLIGVPFHQGAIERDGRRTLTCHSAPDIFEHLLQKIVEKWPDQTSEA